MHEDRTLSGFSLVKAMAQGCKKKRPIDDATLSEKVSKIERAIARVLRGVRATPVQRSIKKSVTADDSGSERFNLG